MTGTRRRRTRFRMRAGTIDLGEAAAEQLALALDPYPRAPGAVLEMEEEPEAAPFAALAAFPAGALGPGCSLYLAGGRATC